MDNNTLDRPLRWGISAATLRLIAMIAMLLDHLWGTIVSGNLWMTCVGRLAFPIYAFQISEGFFHTSDRKRYVKRLVIFALLAEIPYNYMTMSSLFNPFQQNTIWTLLLGLWAVSLIDGWRKGTKPLWKAILLIAVALLLSIVGFVDYGWKGFATVVLFALFRDRRCKWAYVGQLAGMLLFHGVLASGQILPELWNIPLQSFAILALIPIWLYNGSKGWGGRGFRLAAYWYYPVHLAILSLLMWLM